MWDSAIWYSPLVHAPFFTCLSVVVFSSFLCVCVVVVFLSFPLLFRASLSVELFPQTHLQFGGCWGRIVHLGF